MKQTPQRSQAEAAARATRQQLALVARQEKILKARTSLLDFIEFTNPDPETPGDALLSSYNATTFHKEICKSVQKFVEGGYEGCSILILTMPPRHGKTFIVSKHLPAWLMGRTPRQSFIGAAYNDDFAADYGAEVRKIMQSPQFRAVFPEAKLIRGGTAKDRLQTTVGGMATFAGRGGSLTGRGGHILVGDDLIKGADDARSQTIRDQVWDWFTKVFMTRRMGKKLVILTFTRWHSDDPIGRLTDPKNEHYNEELAKRIKIINFPAIAMDDDPLGREKGEPLWPEEHGLDSLLEQKMMDPLGFAALYQQSPTVEDGTLFRRENVNYYDPHELPDNLRIYCASDHAVSTDQRRDATVLLKVGVDEQGHVWLLDCYWKRARTDAVVEAMLLMGGGPRPPLIWWAERGQISKSIGPFLRRRMLEEDTFFNLVEVTPAADKETRAQSISARMGMNFVHFPRNAWWTDDAVSELLSFPNGLHDDFVDAFAYIGLGLKVQTPAGRPVPKKIEPKYGTLGWVKAQQRRDEQEALRRAGGGFG